MRAAEVIRRTRETNVRVRLNVDGTGQTEISTGVGFFDHMLTALGAHAGFDLLVQVQGDLNVDCHHTIEDTGIVLGQALQKALGDAAAFLHAERLAPDTLVLTPGLVSGSAMLNAVCPPSGYAAEQLTVLAGCTQMLDLVHLAGESVVPADAAPELRLAAGKMTLTDHDTGAAAELLYGMVRRAETSA